MISATFWWSTTNVILIIVVIMTRIIWSERKFEKLLNSSWGTVKLGGLTQILRQKLGLLLMLMRREGGMAHTDKTNHCFTLNCVMRKTLKFSLRSKFCMQLVQCTPSPKQRPGKKLVSYCQPCELDTSCVRKHQSHVKEHHHYPSKCKFLWWSSIFAYPDKNSHVKHHH